MFSIIRKGLRQNISSLFKDIRIHCAFFSNHFMHNIFTLHLLFFKTIKFDCFLEDAKQPFKTTIPSIYFEWEIYWKISPFYMVIRILKYQRFFQLPTEDKLGGERVRRMQQYYLNQRKKIPEIMKQNNKKILRGNVEWCNFVHSWMLKKE